MTDKATDLRFFSNGLARSPSGHVYSIIDEDSGFLERYGHLLSEEDIQCYREVIKKNGKLK